MRVMSGTVIGGKVEVPPESIAEGEHVMILVPEPESAIRLTPQDENELLQAMEEIRRGEYVSGTDLLADIRWQSMD